MNQAKMQNMGGFTGGGSGNVQQGNPDTHNQQIMRFIIHSLQQQPAGVGWRAQVGVQERMHWIKQVYVSPSTGTSDCENTDRWTHKF